MKARARRPWLDKYSRTSGRLTGPVVQRLESTNDWTREQHREAVREFFERERPKKIPEAGG
jgi:hypothetical protein